MSVAGENALGQSNDEDGTKVFTIGPTWRAVGFEMTTEQRADEILAQAADQCTPVVGDMENGTFQYVDRSGAVAVFDVVAEKIADIHQDFNASAVVDARWVEMADRFALVDIVDAQGGTERSVGKACVAMRAGIGNYRGAHR